MGPPRCRRWHPDHPRDRAPGPPDHRYRLAQWAEGLGLSRGAAVLAQIATGSDDTAEQWGPCEYITPEVSEALDGEIREDTVGGLLLGQDFLQAIIINLLGPARLMVLLTPTE
jgi:hypothetical protein